MKRWFGALPVPVRIAGVLAALVALGSAVLSWDALVWAGREVHIDPLLAPIYPAVIDGTIGVATVAVFALRKAPRHVRAYVWAMLAGAVSSSVISNGAHSYDGYWLHALAGALPSAGLVVSLHVLIVLARHARTGVERAPKEARGGRARRRREARVLVDGQLVSAGHARKLRARNRRNQARTPHVLEADQ